MKAEAQLQVTRSAFNWPVSYLDRIPNRVTHGGWTCEISGLWFFLCHLLIPSGEIWALCKNSSYSGARDIRTSAQISLDLILTDTLLLSENEESQTWGTYLFPGARVLLLLRIKAGPLGPFPEPVWVLPQSEEVRFSCLYEVTAGIRCLDATLTWISGHIRCESPLVIHKLSPYLNKRTAAKLLCSKRKKPFRCVTLIRSIGLLEL